MASKGQKFQKYSAEFKLKVVKEYLNCEGSFRYLAKKYCLKDKTQLQVWVRKYKEKGSEVFLADNKCSNSKGRPKAIKLEEMSLEEQVKYLKMEVDILKKVKALQKD